MKPAEAYRWLLDYSTTTALYDMYAAQFYAKAEEKLGNLQEMFEAGEFGPFLGWFRQNVHSQGSRHLPRNLVKAVTGEDLNADYLIAHLKSKYGRLYEL
jgi:carboxypeptidase Taq